MIVSHRHKFIFVKTKKTAGTSIEIALSQICGEDDIITPIEPESPAELKTMGFKGIQNIHLSPLQYTAKDWRKRIKGTRPAFRNHLPASYLRKVLGPKIWDEYFKFSVERNPYDQAISRYYWSTRNLTPRPTMEEHLASGGLEGLSNWPIYTIDDQIAVDYMMRFESLAYSLSFVEKKLGLSTPLKLPRAKSNYRKNHEHYSRFISPTVRARIETRCANELDAFGYAWEEADSP